MKNLCNKLIKIPFFALLFGLLPIIILWSHNKLQISNRAVIPVFLITLSAIVLVWLIICIIFHSFSRGSYFSLFLFLLFFSYGHVYNLIKGREIAGIEFGFIKLILVYILVFFIGLIFFIKLKQFSSSFTIWLNILSLFLITINIGQLLYLQIKKLDSNAAKSAVNSSVTDSGQERPDIYYIILDAYARADFLEETYSFNNSSFISELEKRGFYVAKCANSNYDGTLSSLASSLNYSYLDYYNIPEDKLSEGSGDEVKLIAGNQVIKDLSPYGYQFVTTRGYSAFNDVRDSDIYINVVRDPQLQDSLQRSQFSRLFLSTTLIRLIFEVYTANPSEYPYIPYWFELSSDNEYLDSSSFWYHQTLYVFNELEKLPEKPGNFFVYAHINAPHGPYVFDQDGNFRYIKPTDDKKEYYVDTVIYINKRILTLVESLISRSSIPPIIIIQGDHGSHIVASGFDKHKILSAYYLPGSDFQLYDTITPVNTFRIILNEYFQKNIKILPDEMYVKRLNKREIFPSLCENP